MAQSHHKLYFAVVILALVLCLVSGDCIDLDLGMESGRIQDNNIIASSAISQTKNGRLSNARAWCAVTADNINPFLQIDLRTLHIICAVSTQGNPEADQWVETYTLQVSTDGSTWTDYKEDGQVKIFVGNSDRNTVNKNILYEGFVTRFLRFVGNTKQEKFCMRTEVFGVKQKPENLAAGKNTSQSSTYGNGQSWKSVDGNLDMWDSDWQCSHTLEDNPSWWRVDLGSNNVPVYEVLIVNRFSQHDSVRQRSQDYKITLGNNPNVANNSECVGRYSFIQFIASAVCYRNPMSTGRYLGIMTTKKQILQLCEVEVYSRENLAYNKSTEQISTYSDSGGSGSSSRAVDGNSNPDYYVGRTCTHTLAEHYAWWRVDLGQVEPVTEVYVVNRGEGWGWRLGSFEIRVGSSSSNGGVANPMCGAGGYSVPDGQGASFFCRPSLYGRYVIIRNTLIRPNVTLTLCEVEVYSARRACQNQAVGLASSYTFPDSSFSASSSRSGNQASKGRLNGNGSWSPSTDSNANDFLQINLQYEFFICAVATQGNPNADEWTTKYKLLLSLNNTEWVAYQENKTDKIFNGNDGRHDIVKHNLVAITRARFIRFQPVAFQTRKTLRVEVYGVLKPAVPSQPPRSLTATAVSSAIINVRWQLPPADSRRGIITGFKLFYKEKGSTDSQTVETINSVGILASNVTALKKYTEYEFQVLAFTAAGDGPKSSVETERTKEDVPSQAPVAFTVTADTSTSIVAEWQLPPADSRNGIIAGFKLFYKKKGSADSPSVMTINSSAILTKTVSGLEKNTKYEFQVLAFTLVGDGPKSFMMVERTKEEIPPRIVEDVSPPSVICEKQTLCLLGCHATSDYPVTYSWTKKGELPDNNDAKTINNTLAVRASDAKDYGVYVCNAINRFGSTAYNITLSEGHKSSTAVSGIEEKDDQQDIFRVAVIVLASVLLLLIIVIGLLLWRLRRKLPDRTNTPERHAFDNGGQHEIPAHDQHMSEPGTFMELRPRPLQEQPRAPAEYQTLQGINACLG